MGTDECGIRLLGQSQAFARIMSHTRDRTMALSTDSHACLPFSLLHQSQRRNAKRARSMRRRRKTPNPIQVRTGLLALPTSHVPPAGYTWTNERLLMRGPHLVRMLCAGEKHLTTRCWSTATVERMQAAVANGSLVRVQSNYAFDSIVGWALLDSVSCPRPARDVLNDETLKMAGCSHLTQSDYIYEYVSSTCPNPMVVVLVIKQYWPI